MRIARIVLPAVALTCLVATGAGAAQSPTLRDLLARADAVALVHVRSIETRDEGRVRLYQLGVERMISGDARPELVVVELRTGTLRPAFLEANDRALVLLEPMANVSYLRRQVPEPGVVQPVGGNSGIVRHAGDAEARELAESVTRAQSALSPDALRSHVFAQLGSRHPRLVEDAVEELGRLTIAGTLGDAERETVRAVLARPELAEQVRVVLVDRLASLGDEQIAAVLAASPATTPRAIEATLRARAALGSAAKAAELERFLSSSDPGVEAATIGVLFASGYPGAMARVTSATSPDRPREVRHAAIDALGESRDVAALPVLSQTFESGDRAVQQASARAILRVGGAAADDALVEIALHGKSRESRTYAAMLLATRHAKTSPPLVRLASSNPPADVVEVLKKGMQDLHAHHD